MRALRLAVGKTGSLFRSHSKLWVPFLVTACAEAFLLLLVWLAPQPPFSHLFAPPIRYFFGERVLHYPTHLWFLFHAMKQTHLVTSTLLGAFMTGVACVMVAQTYHHVPLSLREALASQQVRYIRVVTIWLITWGIAKGLMAALVAMAPKSVWTLWGVLGLLILVQTLLVYAIPAAVYEGSAWWRAIVQGLREAARYPLSTLMVVFIPSAALACFSLIVTPNFVASWMEKTVPEIAVGFVGARLLVSMFADALMSVAVAHLWWTHRALQRSPLPAAEPVNSSRVARQPAALVEEGPVVA